MQRKTKKILTIGSIVSGILLFGGVVGGAIGGCYTSGNNTITTSSNNKVTITNHFNTLSSTTNDNVVLNNLKYTLDPSTFSATINGYDAIPSTLTALSIPSYIEVGGLNYAITSVSNGAFMNSNISSLTLPDTLLTIGNLSFANNYLQTLTIPADVSSIGSNAFSNNMFNYGTRIFLPVNCTWNKLYGTSSFDTSDNYSVFTPCVQFVIQGSAVYTYNPNQGGYVITSYMPNEIYQQEKDNINKITNNSGNVSEIYSNGSTNPSYTNNNTDTSLNVMPTLLSTLSQTCLSFKGLSNSGTSGWVTFDTKTMTMNYTINSGNSSNEVYNNSADEFTVSMYNPNTNTYTIPLTYEQGWQASKYFAELWQGKTFAYGDIITFTTPASWVGGNNTNALFNISTNYYDGITPSEMNSLYFYNNAWSAHTDQIAAFRITPLGLIPYVNTTTNSSVNVLTPNFSGDFNITGNSTPNTNVYANVNGTVYKTTSSSDGSYSIPITDQSKLTTSSIIQIYSDTSPVYFVHPEGANPNGAIIVFNMNGLSFGITFDGLIGGLTLWYQNSNRWFPSYETPYFTNQSSTLSLDQILYNDTQLTIKATYSTGKTSTTEFDFTNGLALSTMETELNAISLTDLTNIEILCHNINLTNVFNNQRMQQIGYDFVGESSNYNFTYSIQNGIQSTIIPKDSSGNIIWGQTTNTNIGANGDVVYSMTPYSIYGGYSGGWNAKYYFGVYHKNSKGDYSYEIGSNWYDPTPMMYEVAHSLVNGISNPVAQAVQIVRWVKDNFYYNNASAQMDYALSASQEFNNTGGICGNYSSLSAILLTLDGFACRIITGGASDTATLFNGNNAIDHAWVQVWIPTYGEWITLDPTWGWYGNPGNLQSYFVYSRVSETVTNYVFPPYNPNDPQTLFSSYFTNYPWQELNYFGNYYGIANGQNGSIQSPYTVASIAALFENQASLMKNTDYLSDYSNSDNFWTINVSDTNYLDGIYSN